MVESRSAFNVRSSSGGLLSSDRSEKKTVRFNDTVQYSSSEIRIKSSRPLLVGGVKSGVFRSRGETGKEERKVSNSKIISNIIQDMNGLHLDILSKFNRKYEGRSRNKVYFPASIFIRRKDDKTQNKEENNESTSSIKRIIRR